MYDENSYFAGYREGWADALKYTTTGSIFGQPWGPPQPSPQSLPTNPETYTPKKPKRKCSAYSKRLGREIKKLNKKHKSGDKFKKGWNQKRLMKAAHKAAKR